MKKLAISKEVTTKELRSFGLIMAGMLIGLFGFFFPWVFDFTYPAWPWYVALAFAIPAIFLPQSLKYPFKLWMFIGHILGWINTRIILTIVFFFLFTPMGMVARLFGYDPLRLKRDPKATTYRIKSEQQENKGMEHPY